MEKAQRKTEWDRNYHLPQMAMQFITLYCTQICTFYAHHGGRDRDDCARIIPTIMKLYCCVMCDIMISLCGIRWKVEEISSSPWTMCDGLWFVYISLRMSLLVGVNVSEKLKIRADSSMRYYNMRKIRQNIPIYYANFEIRMSNSSLHILFALCLYQFYLWCWK